VWLLRVVKRLSNEGQRAANSSQSFPKTLMSGMARLRAEQT
jgi:hypothetical protein